jgi:uncharacterized protein YbjT (DUF2867 family)
MRIAIAGGTGTAGRHAVVAAEAAGHEVRVLSRSREVDVYSGKGLAQALEGVEAIVDATKPDVLDPARAVEFFGTAAANLQREAEAQGVRHIVTLSIVGIERVPGFGFYEAQLSRERVTRAGPVAVTIMRATQFHEFPGQMIARSRRGGHARIYDMRSQPVAARTVGHVLAELAAGEPAGRAPDLAGPRAERLVDLARAFVAHRGAELTVEPDTESMASAPPDALLPGPGARLEGPSFEEWLDGDDAAALTI